MSGSLAEWRLGAEEAARLGAGILEQWRSKFSVREKGRADLVTEADLAAEQAVLAVLEAETPELGVLAEESGRRSGQGGDLDLP